MLLRSLCSYGAFVTHHVRRERGEAKAEGGQDDRVPEANVTQNVLVK
jgi:hypothetical protein